VRIKARRHGRRRDADAGEEGSLQRPTIKCVVNQGGASGSTGIQGRGLPWQRDRAKMRFIALAGQRA